MVDGGAAFPAYRRMVGADHWYRIEGPDAFEEIQRVGRRLVRHAVRAAAYPERLRIAELLACADGRFAPIGAEEWDRLVAAIG